MRRLNNSLIWGVILLVVGLGFLLWNLGVFSKFQTTAQWVLVGFFALLGLGFFVSYLMSREQWWKVIPAFTLLSIAGIIYLAGRNFNEIWVALVFFLGLALAFAFIYVTDRQTRWWALLPFRLDDRNGARSDAWSDRYACKTAGCDLVRRHGPGVLFDLRAGQGP